ncbi:MAG TPA: hypothetical protein VFF52_19510 [Isosphaeraceae bacterium]|nr:hypothetical protein [Isosphaeraceae bacterium]
MSLEVAEVFRLADGWDAAPRLEEAGLRISARHWFVAALAVYLLWVAALTVLAVTSAARPAPAAVAVPNPSDGGPEASP